MNLVKGQKGELQAVNYLKSKGYKIIERNYRHGKNEVDIIARLGNFLIFIEVKSRSKLSFGYPEEMVTGAQEDRIRDVAEYYLEVEDWRGNIRFDIIAINNNNSEELFHIHDAF